MIAFRYFETHLVLQFANILTPKFLRKFETLTIFPIKLGGKKKSKKLLNQYRGIHNANLFFWSYSRKLRNCEPVCGVNQTAKI